MKTILVLISIMIFGLYSCGDESTSAIESVDLNGVWTIISTKDSLTIIDSAYQFKIINNRIDFIIKDSIFHQTTFDLSKDNNLTYLIIRNYPYPVIITENDSTKEILVDYRFEMKMLGDSLMFLTWDKNFSGNFKEDSPDIYKRTAR